MCLFRVATLQSKRLVHLKWYSALKRLQLCVIMLSFFSIIVIIITLYKIRATQERM